MQRVEGRPSHVGPCPPRGTPLALPCEWCSTPTFHRAEDGKAECPIGSGCSDARKKLTVKRSISAEGYRAVRETLFPVGRQENNNAAPVRYCALPSCGRRAARGGVLCEEHAGLDDAGREPGAG